MNTFGHRPALIWSSGASHLKRILIFKNSPNVLVHSCQIRPCCWIEYPWLCSLCQWRYDTSNLICEGDGIKGFFLKSLTIPLQINGGKEPQRLGLSSEKNEGGSKCCIFIYGQKHWVTLSYLDFRFRAIFRIHFPNVIALAGKVRRQKEEEILFWSWCLRTQLQRKHKTTITSAKTHSPQTSSRCTCLFQSCST